MSDPKTEENIVQRKSSMVLNYAALNQLVLKDLKKSTDSDVRLLNKYKRKDVSTFMDQPSRYEKQLREISTILYNKSSHYKRAVQYYAQMPTLDYMITPTGDFDKTTKTTLSQYKKTLQFVDLMNIKHEFAKMLIVAFREDVFYGYEHMEKNSYFIQPLSPEYCKISSVEDGVYNFAYDFSYFTTYPEKLETFPPEFKSKYNSFVKDSSLKWQELDSTKTICIKINEDSTYAIPPLAAVFEGIFDIQDFKDLRKEKTKISNYKLLIQKLPIREDTDINNDFMIDYDNMMMFHNKAASSIPDEVALITTPMDITDISLNKDGVDNDEVEKATRDYWAALGINQLLFSTDKSSSVGIQYSVKTDETIIFRLLRQIERWMNRRLKFFISNISFQIKLLDTTIYNREEVYQMAVEGATLGLPYKLAAATLGLGMSPLAVLNMSVLENDILDLSSKFIPLATSYTGGLTQEGAPTKDTKDLSDEGLRSKDKK